MADETTPAPAKPWWQSKTIWVNAIALGAMLVQNITGQDYLNTETQVGLLAVVNLILRIITKTQLSS